NLFLNYNRQWGMHSLNAVAGAESYVTQGTAQVTSATNLVGNVQQLGSINQPPGDIREAYSFLNRENYIRSYFTRFNYVMNERYILGLSMRLDGSSRFLGDNRWSYFPALSAGWIISDELFMSPLAKTLTLLKLRGSFGITGNQDIGNNETLTTYSNEVDNRYGEAGLISGGTVVTKLGNPDIIWETTESYDVGLDFGLWNDRVSGYLAYYTKTVSDLLLNRRLPPSTGTSNKSIRENIGDMRNYGWEFDVIGTAVKSNDFDLKFNFNLTTNDSRILALAPELDEKGVGIQHSDEFWRRNRSGYRLGVYYMAWDAGVDPNRGVNTIYELDQEHFRATGETRQTGRVIPATKFNLENNKFYHQDKSPIPTLFGGFGFQTRYRQFDLSASFTYERGRYIYDYNMQRTTDVQRGQAVLRTDLIGNTWTAAHPNATYPELAWNGTYNWDWDTAQVDPMTNLKGTWVQRTGNYINETEQWSKYLFRADYLRLRNVQIGYSLPPALAHSLRMQSMRIYVSGTNLWYKAFGYEGWDPETGGNDLPPLKIYAAGINVKF
ncbi:MAG: TonB-dependent receptor, partial [Cytophagales bacterium]|nr:TonB-dependent receptor [Cytophagales bacterium]